MRIYIAGKITDKDPVKQGHNIERFFDAERMLKDLGHDPYNPARGEPHNKAPEFYYIYDLNWLEENKPDAIFFMRGWRDSTGAKMEYHKALSMGIKTIFEN